MRTILFNTSDIRELYPTDGYKKHIHVYDKITDEYCIVRFSTQSKFFKLLFEIPGYWWSIDNNPIWKLKKQNRWLIYNIKKTPNSDSLFSVDLSDYVYGCIYDTPVLPSQQIRDKIEFEHVELFL